jgi:adenine-specific DNA methylase
MTRPRLLIEEWLPAQAIGVECARERSTGQQPPDKRLHVWWARRPLTVSRAAVLASLLPATFDRATFERLLGFAQPGAELVRRRALMDQGVQVEGSYGGGRAFTNALREPALQEASLAARATWGGEPTVLDPMAGGGSIPLEAARLGLAAAANEYGPVACSLLEATVDYPFRFGACLASRVRKWGKTWESRAAERLGRFYPQEKLALVHAYIFARTVPCPDTPGHPPTPLVPDWILSRPDGERPVTAVPRVIAAEKGEWTIDVRHLGRGAGEVREPPMPTYSDGKGISLYSGKPIPEDYIKAQARAGNLGCVLYAVATKATTGLSFRPAEPRDRESLAAAERELARLRPAWQRDGIIPTESLSDISNYDRGHRMYGAFKWTDLFTPRQLLAAGALVEELRKLRPELLAAEGEAAGEAVLHLLALALDKFLNHNCISNKWECTRGVVKGIFDQHNYAFRATFAELAACVAGGGFAWAIENVAEAYEKLASLPKARAAQPASIHQGSATNLLAFDSGSITAVVVDPPYADNVQYAELADFFYVWLKRTQGYRRPEWFSTYLCERDEEAVVNIARHRTDNSRAGAKKARQEAEVRYQELMTDSFRECHRVLRDDGVLTVMFTHKQQEAWAALFESLIAAGFTITATWPVQTESQHSLHQAQKNAAQSTVILVARKREPNAGRAYFDPGMQAEIRDVARSAAARLRADGLNPVDQLVGAFGPAMEVFSRYDAVRTDTGEPVGVAAAIQTAADAVAQWRVEQLAARGLEGVDAESRFILLCWDVLGAAEFRFNEAMLLGRSVGMDVARLKETGLVAASGDKVKLLPAADRRRERAVRSEREQLSLVEGYEKARTKPARKVHPSDEYFASAIDMCHALALRYQENGAGQNGIGAARGMALQQGWTPDSACARLMSALVAAAPPAVRFPGKNGKKTAADQFPEFRAWHSLLKPLFQIDPPQWKEPEPIARPLPHTDPYSGQDEETEGEDDDPNA